METFHSLNFNFKTVYAEWFVVGAEVLRTDTHTMVSEV